MPGRADVPRPIECSKYDKVSVQRLQDALDTRRLRSWPQALPHGEANGAKPVVCPQKRFDHNVFDHKRDLTTREV